MGRSGATDGDNALKSRGFSSASGKRLKGMAARQEKDDWGGKRENAEFKGVTPGNVKGPGNRGAKWVSNLLVSLLNLTIVAVGHQRTRKKNKEGEKKKGRITEKDRVHWERGKSEENQLLERSW